MSEASKAVFLSYASQDADAARSICEALHAAGIEVWFDQSELVGGDAWVSRFARGRGKNGQGGGHRRDSEDAEKTNAFLCAQAMGISAV